MLPIFRSQVHQLNTWVYELLDRGEDRQAVVFAQRAYELASTTLPDDDPALGTAANHLAELYSRFGQYTEAESLYRQALAICRKVEGQNSRPFATILHNLAMLYKELGRFDESKSMYLQALSIDRATLGENHPDFATGLSGLAEVYRATREFDDAERLMQQALDIRRRAFTDHPRDAAFIAISLDNLADLYRQTGRYDEARPLFDEALAMFRRTRGEGSSDYAVALNNIALLHEALGDFRSAKAALRRSVEIKRTQLGEGHPTYARSVETLAKVCHRMGHFAEARRSYAQALDATRHFAPSRPADYLRLLNNVSYASLTMGDYNDARRYCEEALQIAQQQGELHPKLRAAAWSNLGHLHRAMYDHRSSAYCFQRALEVLVQGAAKDTLSIAAAYNDLALAHQAVAEFAAAEAYYEDAIRLTRDAVGDRHPEYATSLNNLATLYRETDRYDRAEALLREAVTILKHSDPNYRPALATTLNSLAELCHTEGRYTDAEQYYHRSLDIVKSSLGEQHPDMRRNLYNLAELCVAVGRESEALEHIDRAERLTDDSIAQIFTMASEERRMIFLGQVQSCLHVALSLFVRRVEADPTVARIALDLVLRRKAIGADALVAQRNAVIRDPALREPFDELIALRRQLGRKRLEGVKQDSQEGHNATLAVLEGRIDRLETQLAQEIPELRLEQQLRTVTRRKIADQVGRQAAVVEFVRFCPFDFHALRRRGNESWMPARYLAFVVRGRDADDVHMIDMGPAEPIETTLSAFLSAIAGDLEPKECSADPLARGNASAHDVPSELRTAVPQVRRDLRADDVKVNVQRTRGHGAKLRRTIFDPLLPALDGRKRLYLAPDGELARLSFEALPTDNGGHLIDTYTMSYLTVGRDLLGFNARPRSGNPPLVVADPDFDLGMPSMSQRGIRFERLDGTRREGEQVAALLHVSAVVDKDALENRIKETPSPRVLHVASHAFFLPDWLKAPNESAIALPVDQPGESRIAQMHRLQNPFLRSGLALAGANTWLSGHDELLPEGAEDGLLTAEDVIGLDLTDTELVVLSACDTGLGRILSGEGTFGLRRSFILAGADTLVMSLWKVPDQQTCELILKFYRRLLKGQPRAAALRAAQLEVKRNYPEEPYYWGAFICQGNDAPLFVKEEVPS